MKTSTMPAALAVAVFMISAPPLGAHTQAENRAACQSTDPDTSIAACTEDIVSKEEKTPADLAIAYYNRGLAYKDKHDYAKALADLNKAIKLNPNDVSYYNERGVTYQHMKRNSEAIADYRTALNIDPDDDMAANNLAMLGVEP